MSCSIIPLASIRCSTCNTKSFPHLRTKLDYRSLLVWHDLTTQPVISVDSSTRDFAYDTRRRRQDCCASSRYTAYPNNAQAVFTHQSHQLQPWSADFNEKARWREGARLVWTRSVFSKGLPAFLTGLFPSLNSFSLPTAGPLNSTE